MPIGLPAAVECLEWICIRLFEQCGKSRIIIIGLQAALSFFFYSPEFCVFCAVELNFSTAAPQLFCILKSVTFADS